MCPALTSFAIPRYNASVPVWLLRFPLMIAAATLGLIGVISGLYGIWPPAMMLRTGVLLWTASQATTGLFGLRSYRPLVLPLGALSLVLAVGQAESYTELRYFLSPEILFPFSSISILFIPLVLLAVALLKERCRPSRAETPS